MIVNNGQILKGQVDQNQVFKRNLYHSPVWKKHQIASLFSLQECLQKENYWLKLHVFKVQLKVISKLINKSKEEAIHKNVSLFKELYLITSIEEKPLPIIS